MRYLGIDYGAKRVGLAVSDESGRVAFPEIIVENKTDLIEKITKLCAKKKVEQIVLGESLNFKREANPIMVEITKFKAKLEQGLNLPVILEPEWLTSALAARSAGRGAAADDSAAALILQTYLDRL